MIGVSGDDACGSLQYDANRLIDDAIASIPFHLTEDLPAYLKDGNERSVLQDLGKSLGGLLLMHPLYVLSQLGTVQPLGRQNMKDCLAWIGDHMGIGQASVLAEVRVAVVFFYKMSQIGVLTYS